MYSVNVSIIGVAALMQHRFPLPDLSTMAKGSKRSTGSIDYTQEWHEYFYADSSGIYQPSAHIIGAMTKAAASFKISGKRGKSYKDLIQSSIVVTPDRIPHNVQVPAELDADADKPLYLDVRPVVVQRARVVRVRPTFREGWRLMFVIEVIDDEVHPDTLQEILAHAGKAVGIGDFRPRFGRFRVESFEAIR